MAEDLGFTITRDFDAPARRLFRACSQPEFLRRWFGPVGWPLTLCEVDFRVGGRWRFAMTGPSGLQNTPFGGVYLEIVPDARIVFDNTFEAPGAETMVMTFTFDEAAGRTRLTHHTLFASLGMKKLHLDGGFEVGTNSAFDQLAEVARGTG
ncbi:SRPBCC domain-containing protein [Roseococcus sp.]|uniref:SRPBCC domain-containing protein n=1 Tax=Roseococcus sp. TaxID=2109646 RepID=UPI003BA9807E